MDITSHTFHFNLQKILDDLATCCFVAIDLEFSGIPKTRNGPRAGSQTLQERYAETRNAAEKYQILQIGLTICHEDAEKALYTLKPYNIYLSPIIDRNLDLERDFSFQSGAVSFLLENNFNMDIFLQHGVPYLSRAEEHLIMSRALEKHDRSKMHRMMDIKATDHESIAFLDNVRRLVNDWLALGDAREEYLNIPPPRRASSKEPELFKSPLNRFQKRLVHQLIEVEYPSLVTISERAFIQIVDYDEEREKAVREKRMNIIHDRVSIHTGIRWIAEALAGGDLSKLHPGYFRDITSSSRAVGPSFDLNEFSNKLKRQIKSHRPTLVGHNLFTDLVYFCSCFFGPLPEKVEDFQAMAHNLFPTLIDTKYMATHDCGSINPTSSLTEINDNLALIAMPSIAIHHQHGKYNKQTVDHEAGYDSLLTAKVFIKLAAQLRDRGSSKYAGPTPVASIHSQNQRRSQPDIIHERSAKLSRLETGQEAIFPAHENRKVHPTGQEAKEDKDTTNIGHRTKFDLLEVEEPADITDSLNMDQADEIMLKANRGELIPRVGAEFWKIYSNRLRVFGTEERVCILGEHPGGQQITLPFRPMA